MIPLTLTIIYGEGEQWGCYNLPRIISWFCWDTGGFILIDYFSDSNAHRLDLSHAAPYRWSASPMASNKSFISSRLGLLDSMVDW